jgi:sugar O-acyltransferase (sialic acid O-acetyltransferase NeuD family)
MSKKHKLYIIGASNFGREMESWLQLMPEESRDWELKGFLHFFEGKSPLEDYPTDFNIVGDWRDYPVSKDDYCVIAVADCKWKERIFLHLKDRTVFYTYIAPNAVIGRFNTIEEGCIICPGTILTTNIRIGKCVIINTGSRIGHDCRIGDFTSVMSGVDLGGNVTVKARVFIGTNATVIPKMTIGEDATVGAGSVVLKRVTGSTTVFGNPAKEVIY